MNYRMLIPFLVVPFLCLLFFAPSITKGKIPFPGDLLIASYKPWQAETYFGYNPGSMPNKAQYPDTLRQLYPWKTFAIKEIKSGRFPLWNPYNFSGSPLFANFQSAVLYPLNFLYLLFSQPTGWTVLIILQPILSFLFTYFYCKKIHINTFGSLLGAISFSFSSFFTVWLEYNTIDQVVLWLPLILLAIEQIRGNRSIRWSVTLVGSVTASLLGGHPQVFFYMFLFTVLYLLYRIPQKTQKLYVTALLFLGVAIGAVQLIPGIELILYAARSPHTQETLLQKILIQPWQLLMLIVPDFFGNPVTRNYWLGDTYIGKVTSIGLVPLVFITMNKGNRRHELNSFFIASALFAVLAITRNPLSEFVYQLNLPLLSTSSPTLMTFLLCFSLSILASVSVDNWMKRKIETSIFQTTAILWAVLFMILWASITLLPHFIHQPWTNQLPIAKRNLFFSSLLLGTTLLLLNITMSSPRLRHIALFALLLLELGELGISFNKFTPFVPKELVFPKTEIFSTLASDAGINRFWGYGSGAIESNFATQYGVFSPDGYDPLYPRWYGAFMQASKEGQIPKTFTDATRSDAVLAGGFGRDDLANNAYRLRMIDLLGIKYILDRTENGSTQITFPPDRFSLHVSHQDWKIFENKLSVPRAFLVSQYSLYQTPDEFTKGFFSSANNSEKTIFLTEKIPDSVEPTDREDTIDITSYLPTKIQIKSKSSGSRLLFLSDTYFPGWKATVDDKETKIYRANYAFRTIFLPKGEHTVQFLYDPLSFKLGIAVSFVALVMTAIIVGYGQKK